MQRIVAETCEDAAAEEFLMLGPIQMVLVFLVLLWIPMFLWEIPVVFWGGWSNVVVQSLGGSGGNPITDHLLQLPRKEAKVTLNSNGEISFEVSGGGLNKKKPLP